MKYSCFFFLSIIVISCKKESTEPEINYVQSPTETKYIIYLSNDTITHYKEYLNNQLSSSVFFYFSDTSVVKIFKNANNNITGKTHMYLGSNGYAHSSVDSTFNDSLVLINVLKSTYEYDNGFLIRKIIDNGNIFTYKISNGNITSSNISFPGWSSGCTNHYNYTSFLVLVNKIDIKDFSNGITGKISKNLFNSAVWNTGCPCGPSSTSAESTLKYELNNSGYVIKIKEFYIPCYHQSSQTVTGTISTTLFEYK